MEMRIRFPGNKKVSAEWGDFVVLTDQPKDAGGDGVAPAPFDLFLASLGTCAGLFVLGFCRKRGIDATGLELVETVDWDESAHRVRKVTIDIKLPPGFPEQYRDAVISTASLCTVKKHIQNPPEFEIRALSSTVSPGR